jgi:hypothetical protein
MFLPPSPECLLVGQNGLKGVGRREGEHYLNIGGKVYPYEGGVGGREPYPVIEECGGYLGWARDVNILLRFAEFQHVIVREKFHERCRWLFRSKCVKERVGEVVRKFTLRFLGRFLNDQGRGYLELESFIFLPKLPDLSTFLARFRGGR